MAHGGARPNAGRKKHGTNRVTEEAIAKAEAGGEMPLDYLLRIMRDPIQEDAKRIDCAKAAAPYVHAKLNAIEGSFKVDANITEVGWVIRAKPGD